MATAAAEAAQIRRLLEEEDRALERDTRASASVRRACAQVVREERAAGRGGGRGRLLRNAWRRPPTRPVAYGLGRLFGARAQRPSRKGADGKRYVTFHFAVGQSLSRGGAVAHQRYLERAEDCVVSFGNIADAVDERARLWEAIGDRAVHRKGWIVIGADAPEALKEAVIARAGDWGEEGRIGLRHFVDLRQYWKWMRVRTSGCCTTAGVANPTSKRSLKRAAAVAGVPVERPLGKVPAGSTEAVASLWTELRRQNRHFSARAPTPGRPPKKGEERLLDD